MSDTTAGAAGDDRCLFDTVADALNSVAYKGRRNWRPTRNRAFAATSPITWRCDPKVTVSWEDARNLLREISGRANREAEGRAGEAAAIAAIMAGSHADDPGPDGKAEPPSINPTWVVVGGDGGPWSWRWEFRTEAEAREKYQCRIGRGCGERTAMFRMEPTLVASNEPKEAAR